MSMCVCVCSHTQDLISLAQFSAQVRRASRQDERDEYSLTILSSNNIKPQTRRSSMDHNTPWVPKTHNRKERYITKEFQYNGDNLFQ